MAVEAVVQAGMKPVVRLTGVFGEAFDLPIVTG